MTAKQNLLRIDIERTVYFPGETVSGCLHVNVVRPREVAALRLRLVYKEWVDLRRANTQGSGEVVAKQRVPLFKQLLTLEGCTKALSTALKDGSRIMSSSVAVRTQSTGLQHGPPFIKVAPGKYQYPFEFHLPEWLPPTFSSVGDRDDFAAGVCHIKAYIDDPLTEKEGDILVRKFFRIVGLAPKRQFARLRAAPLVAQIEHNYFRCCIAKQVAYRLVANRAERTDRLNPIAVRLELLDASGGVERVKVTLRHLLHVMADGLKETRETVLLRIAASEVGQEYFRVDPLSLNDGEETATNPLEASVRPTTASALAQETPEARRRRHLQAFSRYPPLLDKHRYFVADLPVSRDWMPSFQGVLIHSEYVIESQLDIAMAEDPVAQVNPVIFHAVTADSHIPDCNYVPGEAANVHLFHLTNERVYAAPPAPFKGLPLKRCKAVDDEDEPPEGGHIIRSSMLVPRDAPELQVPTQSFDSTDYGTEAAKSLVDVISQNVAKHERSSKSAKTSDWSFHEPEKKF